MFNNNAALFVGAHYDDIELGCAGTIQHLKKKGFKIFALVITDSVIINHANKIIRHKNDIFKESEKAKKKLKINQSICLELQTNNIIFDDMSKKKFIKYIEKIRPKFLFTHHPFDLHIDHQIVSKMSLNFSKKIPNIFFYECNDYKNIKNFNPSIYIDISKNFNKKIETIKCYKTEIARVKKSWLKNVRIKNNKYGNDIGVKYAEVFEAFRVCYKFNH
jgi:LmbE family N-acetylglucosaminyl deacetylase